MKPGDLQDWLAHLLDDELPSAQFFAQYYDDQKHHALVDLPLRPGPLDCRPGPEIMLTRDEILSDGRVIGAPHKDPREVAPTISELRRIAEQNWALVYGAPRPRGALCLAIERDARWSAVVALMRAAREAGYAHVTLVFTAPRVVAAPPPPYTTEERRCLDQLERGDSAKEACRVRPGPLAARVTRQCPAIEKDFAEVGGVIPGMKVKLLARSLPTTLEKCGWCKIDVAGLRASLWLLFKEPSRSTTAVGVTVSLASSAAPAARVISAPPQLPWSEGYRLVIEGAQDGRPLRLRAN